MATPDPGTEWPPSGITLRSWSDYLLWAYPLDQLPADCGGPPTPAEPPDAAGTPPPGTLPIYTPIDPPPGYGAACDPLKLPIDLALSLISGLTCRDMQAGVPPELQQVAMYATTLYVEQLTYLSATARRASTMSTASGGLRSFTAGPYSESYFGPGEIKYAWNVLNPDPLLNSMLMALITPECLQARMAAANGTYPPAYATQEIQWDQPGYAPYGWVTRYYDPYYNPSRGGDWLD